MMIRNTQAGLMEKAIMVAILVCLLPQNANARKIARRPARIVADINVLADTAVRQKLARIEEKTVDGKWLLASATDIPLLDRWRAGEETPVPDTVLRTIRNKLLAAGVTPTDTAVRTLVRRVRRFPAITRYEDNGIVRQGDSGLLELRRGDEIDLVDSVIAEILIRDENEDRLVLQREVERQIITER